LVNGGLWRPESIVHVDAKAGDVLAETLLRPLERKVISGRPAITPNQANNGSVGSIGSPSS
jgi:hypothetical protein